MICINNFTIKLSKINLKVHKYKLKLKLKLLFYNKTAYTCFFGIFKLNACIYAIFVKIATKHKVRYKQAAREKNPYM